MSARYLGLVNLQRKRRATVTDNMDASLRPRPQPRYRIEE